MNSRPSIRAHPARVRTLPAPPGARAVPASQLAERTPPTAAFGERAVPVPSAERAVPVSPTAPYLRPHLVNASCPPPRSASAT